VHSGRVLMAGAGDGRRSMDTNTVLHQNNVLVNTNNVP
jgi:hypothetical protein